MIPVHRRQVDSLATTTRRNTTPKVRGHKPLLSDAQILEMRALSDFAGFSNLQLSDRFDVDMDMVNRVISGVTRSRLVATRKHLPEGVTPL